MVQVSQTEEDIKIIIELNRLVTRKPDIVLLPKYIKFHNPPIFFERHLTQDIEEMSSFCRIFKSEARIVLIKKAKGIWPEIFQNLSKEELMKKRLEIAEIIVERNKDRDQKTLERYEAKRKAEIEKEVKRETAMRERVKQFQENVCRDALSVDVRGSNCSGESNNWSNNKNSSKSTNRTGTPVIRSAMSAIRGTGKINVAFTSSHKLYTPKRESQEVVPSPIIFNDQLSSTKSSLDSVQ